MMEGNQYGLQRRNGDDIQPRKLPSLDAYILDAPTHSESESATKSDYTEMFLRRKWLMALVMVCVIGLGMAYTVTRRAVYESGASIVVVSNRPEMTASENDVPLMSDLQALTRSRSAETQAEIIGSPDLLKEAYGALNSQMRSKGFRDNDLPTWAVKVAPKKETDIIDVTCRAYTPEAAVALANTVVSTYFSRDLKQNSEATRRAREYVESKMTSAEKDLGRANTELALFKQRTRFFAPDAQLTKAAEQAAQLSLELGSAKTEVAATDREVSALRSEISSSHQDVTASTTITPNPQFSSILENIGKLDSERAQLLQEFTPQSPEVRQMDNRIKHEEARLKQVASTVVSSKMQARNPVRDDLLTRYGTGVAGLAAARAKVRALNTELAAMQKTTQSLPEREKSYSELSQRVVLLQRTYDMLTGKYNALLLSEQAMLPNGMLVSKAQIPSSPAYPNPKRSLILFTLLGLMLSLTVAMIAERLDNRLHDQNVVEQITGLPALSIVPKTPRDSVRLQQGNPSSALLESFRILRNNVSMATMDNHPHKLAITSPGRGEGKSTTSVNLAIAMAMDGKKVLLVDADLRRPSLHAALDIPCDPGLSSVLAGTADWKTAVVKTNIPNVFCLPSGPIPVNATEMLNSEQSKELFNKLGESFDIVLIDCPPSTGLSDVQVISTLADGVLLVVSMHQTLRPHLDMTLRTLSLAGAPLTGLVINRMDVGRLSHGYYYYQNTIDG